MMTLSDQHPWILICSTIYYGAFPRAFFSLDILLLKNGTLSSAQRLKFWPPQYYFPTIWGFFFFWRNFEAEVIHVILANLLESSQWECLWYGKTIHLGRIHMVIESSDGNWLKPLWKYLWQNRGANLTANSPSNPYSDALHSSTSLPSFFIFYFFTRVLIKVLGYVKGKTFHMMAHLNFKQ